MKVNLLGFSVTADTRGYATLLTQDTHRPDGVEVVRCGLGGCDIFLLPYIYEEILGDQRFDVVLLDVTTCGVRNRVKDPDAYRRPVEVLINKIRRHGAEPAFVHLYRKDVDFDDDVFIDTCDQLAESYGIATLNLGKAIQNATDTTLPDRMVWDVVHTTPFGAELYATGIGRFIAEHRDRWAAGPGRWDERTAAAFASIPAARLLDGEARGTFARAGYAASFVELASDVPYTARLGDARRIAGLTYLMGPRTGKLRVQDGHGGWKTLINCYDEHCYYERLHSVVFPAVETDELTFLQLPDLPTAELRKGDRDDGPRVGRIVSLLIDNSRADRRPHLERERSHGHSEHGHSEAV